MAKNRYIFLITGKTNSQSHQRMKFVNSPIIFNCLNKKLVDRKNKVFSGRWQRVWIIKWVLEFLIGRILSRCQRRNTVDINIQQRFVTRYEKLIHRGVDTRFREDKALMELPRWPFASCKIVKCVWKDNNYCRGWQTMLIANHRFVGLDEATPGWEIGERIKVVFYVRVVNKYCSNRLNFHRFSLGIVIERFSEWRKKIFLTFIDWLGSSMFLYRGNRDFNISRTSF